ncbi:DUF4259 domain-containing protein [Lujinxingia sediminis]|uniref:DUF4259 domain-containing protein n=1 Tax=Lujinxingia sediminis TaxID=2480984 RepID=A0ABY0CY34_9DELT|nr:DUF4259 domain-containing protein [Lujinxingia sediminis]
MGGRTLRNLTHLLLLDVARHGQSLTTGGSSPLPGRKVPRTDLLRQQSPQWHCSEDSPACRSNQQGKTLRQRDLDLHTEDIMGAWGHEPFSNDHAMDWLHEMLDAEDDEPLIEALGEIAGAEPDEYLDADLGSIALAAAALIAALGGSALTQLPEALVEWIDDQDGEVITELYEKHAPVARAAVVRVRVNSELAELWEESDDARAWLQGLDELEAALSRAK